MFKAGMGCRLGRCVGRKTPPGAVFVYADGDSLKKSVSGRRGAIPFHVWTQATKSPGCLEDETAGA